MSKYKILKEYEQCLMYIDDILKKSGTTTNIDLERVGKILFGYKFLGVFSAEEFPKRIYDGEMFIINNKSSKQRGEHWISFIKSSKNKDHKSRLYGYDTYNRDIKKLNPYFKHKKFVNANSDRDESFSEKDCGQRSLAYLVLFSKYGDKCINII